MNIIKNCSLKILLLIIITLLLSYKNLCFAELFALPNSHHSSCQHTSISHTSCHNSLKSFDHSQSRESLEQFPVPSKTNQNDPQMTKSESFVVDSSHCPMHITKSNEIQSLTNTITTYDFDCKQLNFCDDRLGFEAILYLHRQLDEDANGDIDVSESDEFIRDELKYENGAERQKAFHGNDKHITVDELWHAWCVSIVHNWTVDETIEWLNEVVELPKYQDAFETHGINGIALPRLAASNSQFFNTLGINNPIHKQKIALKAMDVVLFGVPKPKSSNKDLIMGFLFVFATVVGWYAYYQHKYSKEYIRKMMKEIEALSSAEKQLESLQMELDQTKQKNEEAFKEKQDLERMLQENKQQFINNNDYFGVVNVDADGNRIKELEEELKNTKCELQRIEQAYHSRQWIPSRSLQQYLQLTYEIETRYYNSKKTAAESQLQAAREGCDKLKRKRSSIFGAFRMAHSSSIDYVDSTIIQARTLLAELTNEMQERIKRWKQIESYCGFEIIHNPGLDSLEQQLYGANTFKNSTSTTSLSKLLRRGSEATFGEEDTMSLVSAPPATYSYNTYNPTVQAIQLWQNHQIPANLAIKRISAASVQPLYQQMSPTTTEENFTNGFYIGDQPNNGKKTEFKKKTMVNSKAHLFYERRGSSDGVEKHFEELNNQHVGSQSSSSQSESNIYDNSSICSAYYQKQNSTATCFSKSEFNSQDNNNDSATIITSSNSYHSNQMKKDATLAESNEETFSTSSNDSTSTLNNASGANDLSQKFKTKKRRFFAIRKNKPKPSPVKE